jgi:hypothetical protein
MCTAWAGRWRGSGIALDDDHQAKAQPPIHIVAVGPGFLSGTF